MTDAICSQAKPYVLELESGEYWWCSCGRTKTQPFCDGSHEGTSFRPVSFELTEKTQVYLCGCRRTAEAPMCDGAHKKMK